MNIVISGSGSFDDYKYFQSMINEHLRHRDKKGIVLVAGDGYGTDSMTNTFASRYHYEFKEFLTDKTLSGKRASMQKNMQMLDIADEVIVFWDGRSKGAAHIIGQSLQRKIKIKVFDI